MARPKRKGVGDAAVPKTTRLNVRIDTAASRRLHVHALMSSATPGKILSDLIERHLRDYRVQEIRGGEGDPGESGEKARETGPAPHLKGL